MIEYVISTFGPYIIGAIAVLFAAWRLVRFGEKLTEAKIDRAKRQTLERIEDAKERASAGGAGWHDRLHSTHK